MEGLEPTLASILKKQGDQLIYSQLTVVLVIIDIKVPIEKRKSIIEAKHNAKLVGHLGIIKTIKLITRDFT